MRGTWFLSSGWGQVVTPTVTVGAMVGACSAPPVDGAFGAGAGSGEAGSGAANGQGGSSTSSGAGNGGGNGNGGSAGGVIAGSSSGGGSGGSCTAKVYQAQQQSLGMYLMMDKSGSMQGANWTAVTNAIKAFVDQPSTAGIGVGLDFFPGNACPDTCNTDVDCGMCGPCTHIFPNFPGTCTGTTAGNCNATDYATPTVAISNLPGIAPLIKSSLDNTSPSGGTPTSAALDGSIQYTKQWMTMNPNTVGVAIFATDGEPSDCDTDVANIYALAAAGFAGTPSVRTYVIGVGTQLTFLNGLAASGGTMQAYLVDTNANAQQEFLQAMNEIRGSALSCAYLIPPPPAGEMIDYNAINVRYTPSSGTPSSILHVASLAACPSSSLAWYYDSSAPSQQILLCPSACDLILADTTGQVDILVGCAK